ncbi:hypothetical protein [Fodinicola feengrottensis]|uniref:hypothetical protein n=1 Tax=Fodinicola feengrottensis TaxID=435914 RepID=UPI0013CF9F0B|nr:hypothetical protein [Fodinicola feengrottensis]
MLAATTATVVDRWRDNKPAAVATAVSTASAVALTAYLVRTVNIRLIREDTLSANEQAHLVSRWHRLNAVRLAPSRSPSSPSAAPRLTRSAASTIYS